MALAVIFFQLAWQTVKRGAIHGVAVLHDGIHIQVRVLFVQEQAGNHESTCHTASLVKVLLQHRGKVDDFPDGVLDLGMAGLE